MYLGTDYDVTHFEDLHDLGYLPIEVKSIEEGIIEEVDRGNGFEGYRVQNKNLGGKNGFNMGNFYVKFPAEVYEAPQD
jgi:hypothetical protein